MVLAVSSSLSVSLHFYSEQTGFNHLPFIYLNLKFQDTCTVVSELVIFLPWGTTLSVRVFMYSSFQLWSYYYYLFLKVHGSIHFPPTPSVKLFHSFVIWLAVFVIFCILSWNSLLLCAFLNDLKNIFIYMVLFFVL